MTIDIVTQYESGIRYFAHSRLSHANLSGANLFGADLSGADLHFANLSGANLSHANLSGTDLSGTDLSGADLHFANLSGANLYGANLSGADLSGADLSSADLSWADLSSAKGLLSPIDWLETNFEKDLHGYIVYKIFGLEYSPSPTWKIEPGSILSETVNPLRTNSCACGINVATKRWIDQSPPSGKKQMWKCRIRWEWLAGVVVPYNTDGKFRCERLELLEIVDF